MCIYVCIYISFLYIEFYGELIFLVWKKNVTYDKPYFKSTITVDTDAFSLFLHAHLI